MKPINHLRHATLRRQLRHQLRYITTTETTTKKHIITSRRLLPPPQKPPPASKRAKEDDAPWPKSLRILGYSALALSVPFSIGACIVEQPSFRRLIAGDEEDEKRGRWGERLVQFVRECWCEEEFDPDRKGSKSFQNEISASERKIQRDIGQRNREKSLLRVSCSDGEELEELAVLNLGGDFRFEAKELLKEVNGRGFDLDPGKSVVVQFLDEDGHDITQENDVQASAPIIDTTITTTNQICTQLQEEAHKVRTMTQAFSTWYHHSSTQQTISDNKVASDDEIRKMELEWTEQQLLTDIKDPNCTRDIDDMQKELKEVRKELARHRGWRRVLGF